METFIGKHKGHIITGEFVPNPEGGKPMFKVNEWTTPDGKAAPKKAGLVGKTFKSVTVAGVAAFKATNEHFGTPEKLEGRSLVFKSGDGISASNKAKAVASPVKKSKKAAAEDAPKANGKKSAKAAKAAAKKAAPVVEDDEDEEDEDDDFELPEIEALDEADEDDVPTEPVRKVKKGSKAAAPEVATKKSKKSKKVAKTPTAESYSIFTVMDDGRPFCAACCAAFEFDGEGMPDECPEGHTTDNFRDMLSGS